ncbi:ProQ/FINO family protein [Oceanospirillum sp.]|uniref:ProQ/FINO family protein n=1 Tax=Oceanospirillum sp. TaxID=2021254 RepID=UPI003A92B7BA
MPSDSSANTLDHLFNELNERADNSFQALRSHHKRMTELNRHCNELKVRNQSLQEHCNYLERTLENTKAELNVAQGTALRADVAATEGLASVEQDADEGSERVSELEADNERLVSELDALKIDYLSLSQELGGLQQRLKNLLDGSLLESSDAVRALIRETLDPTDWLSEKTADQDETPHGPVMEKFDAKAILAHWSERYPKAFSTVTIQPLKIGIHEDLAEHEALPDHWIRRALAGYVRSPRYLRVLKTGAVRMDLSGNNAGFVTEEEAGHAKEQLEGIRQQRLQKEKSVRIKEEKKRLNSKLSQLLTKK